jgi:hypothetical protein
MDGGTGGTLEKVKKKLQPGAYGHFVTTASVSLARKRAITRRWWKEFLIGSSFRIRIALLAELGKRITVLDFPETYIPLRPM